MALASSGITISAIKTALGSSSNNLGSLCTNSNINKWSRWKPISYSGGTLTESILKLYKFGLNITQLSNWGLVTTLYANQYTYNKPTGGSTSPYREGDFRNYNHSANCFFNRFEASNTTVYAGNDVAFLGWFNTPTSGSISLSDIVINNVAASDCYFGVVAVKNNTTNYYVITDSYKAGTGSQFGVSVPFNTAYETWKVYPCLSSTAYTSLTLNPINPSMLISLPNTSPITVSVLPLSALYQIAINNCTVTERAGKISVSMEIWMKNNGGSNRTFNLAYQVVGVDSLGNTETLRSYYSIVSLSVAAGSEATVTKSHTFNAVTGLWDSFIVSLQDLGTGYVTSWETMEY